MTKVIMRADEAPAERIPALRLLLVEDSPEDAKLIVLALRGTGRPVELERVQTAEAMRAALGRAAWDIVISDWSMPSFSAAAALDVLKEAGCDLPFIIVSGAIGEDSAVEAMRAGARDYVLKDRLGRLAPAVERELREAEERRARRAAEGAVREAEARLQKLAAAEALLAQVRALNLELEERVTQRTSQLTATLKEREVLLQEVHHRVKNNLQVISSLINMQMRRMSDATSRTALAECRSRVQAMALIHDRLYQANDYARVPFAEYAQRLAAAVLAASGMTPGQVSLRLAFESVSLAVDKAIPCGLILNELITNALKHGFQEGRSGTLGVELARLDGGRLRLAVWDDGAGIAKGVDVRASPSLGMQLVFTLADQLDGAVEVLSTGGTRFELTFPGGESCGA